MHLVNDTFDKNFPQTFGTGMLRVCVSVLFLLSQSAVGLHLG